MATSIDLQYLQEAAGVASSKLPVCICACVCVCLVVCTYACVCRSLATTNLFSSTQLQHLLEAEHWAATESTNHRQSEHTFLFAHTVAIPAGG
jgi:hypothetical protein